MGAVTNTMAGLLLPFLLKAGSLTPPAGGLWMALHTTDPGDAMSGEVSGTGYARIQVPPASWGSVSTKTIATIADIVFPTAGSNWGSIGWGSLWSAVTSGNPYLHGPLGSARTVNTGDTYRCVAGNFSLVLS